MRGAFPKGHANAQLQSSGEKTAYLRRNYRYGRSVQVGVTSASSLAVMTGLGKSADAFDAWEKEWLLCWHK